MREIKFRCFVKDGKYWKHFTLGELILGEATGGEEYDEFENWTQWTGLKDKNGVEIYEGDIVRSQSGYIGKLEWIAEMDDYDWTGWNASIGYDDICSSEVIGNIYESPELLEDNNQ